MRGNAGVVARAMLIAAAFCLPAARRVSGQDPGQEALGTRLDVFVPATRPGLELTGGFLLLQPGADNLGFATTTTFLPVQNPQWAVHTLNPGYQPGFTFGARYTRPNSGKDIRTNWEHLRTNDSMFVPVSNLKTQWISPFSQTVNIGTSTQARLFAGVSWVRLQEQLVSTFYNNPNVDPVPPVVAPVNPDLQYIKLKNTSTFTGAGPRLGLTTNHSLQW
jgi:hypothetical protein